MWHKKSMLRFDRSFPEQMSSLLSELPQVTASRAIEPGRRLRAELRLEPMTASGSGFGILMTFFLFVDDVPVNALEQGRMLPQTMFVEPTRAIQALRTMSDGAESHLLQYLDWIAEGSILGENWEGLLEIVPEHAEKASEKALDLFDAVLRCEWVPGAPEVQLWREADVTILVDHAAFSLAGSSTTPAMTFDGAEEFTLIDDAYRVEPDRTVRFIQTWTRGGGRRLPDLRRLQPVADFVLVEFGFVQLDALPFGSIALWRKGDERAVDCFSPAQPVPPVRWFHGSLDEALEACLTGTVPPLPDSRSLDAWLAQGLRDGAWREERWRPPVIVGDEGRCALAYVLRSDADADSKMAQVDALVDLGASLDNTDCVYGADGVVELPLVEARRAGDERVFQHVLAKTSSEQARRLAGVE
ncbi:MAG: hypothetical protein ACOC1F_07880 [Myxococcota bacterium]